MQVTVADLIPDYWSIEATSFDALREFGSHTLNAMLKIHEASMRGIDASIEALEDDISLLIAHPDAEAICAEAEKFENPSFPPESIAIRSDSWGDDPEPTDAASINRKAGATTFNRCGWCEHVGGGSGRYQYMIKSNCRLIYDALGEDCERRFDSECPLKGMPSEFFAGLRAGLVASRVHQKEKRLLHERIVKQCKALKEQAIPKPPLSDHRPHDWFNLDDLVVCYVGGWEECLSSFSWARATVINGYRHHDGCVSVCYTEKMHEGDNLGGHGGGYGMSRPEVLHEWEYEYLRDNWEFALTWLHNSMPHHREETTRVGLLESLRDPSAVSG